MSVCIYRGGYQTVRKSGVGKALEHQAAALKSAGLPLIDQIPPAGPEAKECVVHLNTVLPSAPLAAARAHARGCKVVYYGHSTMEDFRNSFFGSNLLAPLFKRWLIFCYRQGDVVITPSVYSRRILMGYKIGKPIYTLSNGIDTGFFHPDPARGARFRDRYGLAEGQKCVISVGHWMVRKGLPDFVELARRMPEVRFIWFGQTDQALLTEEIRRAMEAAPGNVLFAGFVGAEDLCDAYCGADAFAFLSHEETEGIVVLEALACGIPTIVRDIPVYANWLEDGKSVYKAANVNQFEAKLRDMLSGHLPSLKEGGMAVAEARSLSQIGQALCRIYASGGFLDAAKADPAGQARPHKDRQTARKGA